MDSLLSTTYFGPVQWYQKLYRSDRVYMEQHESFIKQTYRNRCIIATTNGPLALSVPVIHESKHESVRDILISSHGNWQHQHWNAMQTAYGDSPFLMYYADELRPFFEKQWKYLFDFNTEITETVCRLIDISPDIRLTEGYVSADRLPSATADYREAINPKQPADDPDFEPRRYWQVFEQRYGFMPNLSVLDLLFCCGPESIYFL